MPLIPLFSVFIMGLSLSAPHKLPSNWESVPTPVSHVMVKGMNYCKAPLPGFTIEQAIDCKAKGLCADCSVPVIWGVGPPR